MRITAKSSARPAFMALAVLAACLTMIAIVPARAQAPAAPGDVAQELSPEDLDKLVGPIALYPDDLVAIILPASTNPLQLVQAERFLDKRKGDPKLELDANWDDSVKSLVNYPEVIKQMSTDLEWTADLGEAVVADQGAVLDAVQAFRRKVQAAGNLKTDSKQVVEVEKEVIKIVPADPQVIYVPQYNPSSVVVYSSAPVYGYWPSPYPVYHYPYPPGAALATGLIWGAAIGAAWNGGHWNTNWGGSNNNNNITINRGDRNINRGDINSGNVNRPSQRPSAGGGGAAWKSDKRPGQVSNGAGRTNVNNRVGDARPGGFGGGAGARPSTRPGGGMAQTSLGPRDRAAGAGASGAATRSAGGRDGGGRDAFGSYGSGTGARADSSRGAASRNAMSSQAARPAAGASARTGGGGGMSGRAAGGGGGMARAGGGGGGARAAAGGGGARAGGGGGGGGGRGRR